MKRWYTKEHEWLIVQQDEATVGITDYAQSQLGDVVFVELPEVGKKIKMGQETAVVESVKVASEVFSPIDGEVTAVNQALIESPGLLNSSPYDQGWILKIKLESDINPEHLPEHLMDEAAYSIYLQDIH